MKTIKQCNAVCTPVYCDCKGNECNLTTKLNNKNKLTEMNNAEKGNEYLKKARYAQAALAMVGLRFDLETSLLIKNTMAAYLDKGVHFSVNDAINVRYNTSKIIESEKINEQEHETSK